MKKAATPSYLLDRSLPFLAWWQELILNWVATWPNVSDLVVVSADRTEYGEWNVPSDLELARAELEELIQQ